MSSLGFYSARHLRYCTDFSAFLPRGSPIRKIESAWFFVERFCGPDAPQLRASPRAMNSSFCFARVWRLVRQRFFLRRIRSSQISFLENGGRRSEKRRVGTECVSTF